MMPSLGGDWIDVPIEDMTFVAMHRTGCYLAVNEDLEIHYHSRSGNEVEKLTGASSEKSAERIVEIFAKLIELHTEE